MNNIVGIKKSVVSLLLIISIMGTCAAAPNLANSGGGVWQYYREITITEKSGSTLSDYQVLVQISGGNFPTTRSDGADIRFTDANEKELSYWIEKWDNSGRNARIWVKVPNIQANGEVKMRMYYGNPSANAESSGVKVFNFFDDFSENTIGINWIEGGGTGVIITKGNAKIPSPDPHLYTVLSFNRPLIIESRVKSDSASQTGNFVPFALAYSDGQDFWSGAYVFDEYNNGLYILKGPQTKVLASAPQTTAANIYYILSAILTSSNIFVALYDDERNVLSSASVSDPDYNNKRISIDAYASPGSYAYFDWISVRKYASPEPTVTILSEQIVPTPTIAPTPALSSSPDPLSFNFGSMNSGESSSQSISISNTGSGTLTWSVMDDQPWITLNPASGTNSGTVEVKIDTKGLNPGSHTGNIMINSNSGTKSGKVFLNILPAVTTPSPTVTTPIPAVTTPPILVITSTPIIQEPFIKLDLILISVIVIIVLVTLFLIMKKRGKSDKQKPVKQELEKCPKCGAKVVEGASFCDECGEKL